MFCHLLWPRINGNAQYIQSTGRRIQNEVMDVYKIFVASLHHAQAEKGGGGGEKN